MLREARPTAVNLAWAMDRMDRIMALAGDAGALVREAEAIFAEDVLLCESLARHGVGLLAAGEAVLTHCNSGGLATRRDRHGAGGHPARLRAGAGPPRLRGRDAAPPPGGAAHGVGAREAGDPPHAHHRRDGRHPAPGRAGAAGPGGGRPHPPPTGTSPNKVGTYGLAVQARFHGVPFHPVAPYSTVDPMCPDGGRHPHRDAQRRRGPGLQGPALGPEIIRSLQPRLRRDPGGSGHQPRPGPGHPGPGPAEARPSRCW